MSDFDDRLRAALTQGAEEAPDASRLSAGARQRLKVRRRRVIMAGAVAAAVAIVTPAVVLAGGNDRATDDPGPVGDPEVPADLRVTCGDEASWPVAAMDGGIEHDVDDGEVRDAFVLLLAEAPMDAPAAVREQGADAAPYIVLAERGDEVTIGVGDWSLDGPGADGQYLRLEADGDGLRASSWGDCTLSVAVPDGRSRVEVKAPTGGVDPSTTEPVVEVNEVECTSGRDPLPHLGEPVVVKEDDRVLVGLTSKAVVGGADCQGNPSVPLTLELDEPLGDRQLYDAGTWPPTPIKVADEAAATGWTTHELGWMTFELPPGWDRLDCDDGWVQYGPSGGCGGDVGVSVLESDATFDPFRGPGVWPSEESPSGSWEGWAGHVHVGEGVINVQGADRDDLLRVLGSARLPEDALLDLAPGWEPFTENGLTFEVPADWEEPYGVDVLDNRQFSSRFDLDRASAHQDNGRWVIVGDVDGNGRVTISAPTEGIAELVAASVQVGERP